METERDESASMIRSPSSIEDNLFVVMIHEETYESEDTFMMWGYGLNWPSMTLMMFGSTLWIVLVVVLVWAVMRWLNHRTGSAQANMLPGVNLTGMEILNQRYARGEIDTTTFEQMRERLGASDNVQQRNRVEVRKPVGEKLFD